MNWVLVAGGVLAGATLGAAGEGDLGAIFESVEPERLATGFVFTEGPVWNEEGFLLFSDIPSNRIHRWVPDGACTAFRDPSGNSNGLTYDRQGRLLACEHGNRRVSRTDRDGKVTVLADRFEGKRLNSPNDVVVKSDGAIYFTDPPYGIKPEQKELDFHGVYRIAPEGGLSVLLKDFDRPNGLAFSPDEKVLYICDTARRHVRAFDVQADGTLANSRVLCEIPAELKPSPDGMKVDVQGNLYVTAGQAGLWVFAPSGRRIGRVVTPESVANCAFGGPENRTLFLTASKSVYRLRTRVAGVKTF